MVFFPNAKINLGLFVTGKRSDGYHNIQTVLLPVPLCDALEILNAGDGVTSLSTSGLPVGGEKKDNLVMKAWEMLRHDFNLPAVKMYLHKAIPAGAGLGGGSADAAFAIRMINRHFNLNLSIGQMKSYAGRLGMDCPFFIENEPAFATGRGDRLESLRIRLTGKYLIIVKPECRISTREAYTGVEPVQPGISLPEVLEKPIIKWKYLVKNDFEKPVFRKCPEIKTIKERLYDLGATFALMTGSGSAVFAIFDKMVDLQRKFPRCFYFGKQL